MYVFLYMMNGDNIGKIEVSNSMTVRKFYDIVRKQFSLCWIKLIYNGDVLDEYQYDTKVIQYLEDQAVYNVNMYIVIKYIRLFNMQGETIGEVHILLTTTFKELFQMVKEQCPELGDDFTLLHNGNDLRFCTDLYYYSQPNEIVFKRLNIDFLIVVTTETTTETTTNENHKIAKASYVLMTAEDISCLKYSSIDISKITFLNQRYYQDFFPIYVYYFYYRRSAKKYSFYDKNGHWICTITV